MSEPVVQVNDLVKRYGEIEAVRGINFAVTAGEAFGFPGPNGAGKTRALPLPIFRASRTVGSWVFSVPRRGSATVVPEQRMTPVSRKESRDFPRPCFTHAGRPPASARKR